MVKVYLSRKGIPFTERNVSTDQDSLMALVQMGFRSTPVTIIGEQQLIGYSPAKIESALQAAGISGE